MKKLIIGIFGVGIAILPMSDDAYGVSYSCCANMCPISCSSVSYSVDCNSTSWCNSCKSDTFPVTNFSTGVATYKTRSRQWTCSNCVNTATCVVTNTRYECASGWYGSPTSASGPCTRCPENATCPGGTTFTCNRGYRINADGTGCTKIEQIVICKPGEYKEDGECKDCPSPGTSSLNASGITSCYIPSGYTGSDTSGSYEYAANCYYK